MPDLFDNLEDYSWFSPLDVLIIRDAEGNAVAYGVKDETLAKYSFGDEEDGDDGA